MFTFRSISVCRDRRPAASYARGCMEHVRVAIDNDDDDDGYADDDGRFARHLEGRRSS